MTNNSQPLAVSYAVTKNVLPLFLFLGTLFAMAPGAAGQTPIGCNTGWATIQHITGSFQLTGSGSQTTVDSFGDTSTTTVKQNINGTVDMMAFGLPNSLPGGGTCYLGVWTGTSAILVNLDDVSTSTNASTGITTTTEVAVSGGQNLLAPPTSNPLTSPNLFANPPAGTFRLTTGSLEGVDTGSVNATQTTSDAGVVSTQQVQASWGPIMTTAVPAQGNFLTVPLPATVGPISGSASFQAAGGGLQAANWTLTWSFAPAPPSFDLIVSMPAYTTWRPTAGKTEKDTGLDPATGQPNTLEIDTQLIDKSTGQTAYPDKLVFSLVQVSTEPGVTLNWPAAGTATSDPDLTFDSTFNPLPLATVSPDGMSVTLVPVDGVPLVAGNTFLSPHDWGGWATLNVTATVDGQTIIGHLKDDANTTDILVPKRQPGSFIPDSWKADHDISLSKSDSDDSETSTDNNPNPGDGLTLYEEYRGIYVHCPTIDGVSGSGCISGLMHREGDPNKKDLFVVNKMGPDVLPGIVRFAAGTGLNVCCRTLGDDQITVDHVINFNHSQGPHEVDQHAVIIVKGNPSAPPCTLNGPAQPKDIKQIYFPPMAGVLADIKQESGSDRVKWAQNTYPQAVAHELGHSVDVWHHGEIDNRKVVWVTLDGTSVTEVPSGGLPVPIKVLAENGQELKAPDLHIELGKSIHLWQGVTSGQHSGDVFCFMRYDVSQNYIANSDPGVRYFVAEAPGFYLTDIVQGTGPNSAGRTPQSRYGDASSGRGNCSKQLCVNDHLTPAPVGAQAQGSCPGQN